MIVPDNYFRRLCDSLQGHESQDEKLGLGAELFCGLSVIAIHLKKPICGRPHNMAQRKGARSELWLARAIQ